MKNIKCHLVNMKQWSSKLYAIIIKLFEKNNDSYMAAQHSFQSLTVWSYTIS